MAIPSQLGQVRLRGLEDVGSALAVVELTASSELRTARRPLSAGGLPFSWQGLSIISRTMRIGHS